MVLGRNSGKFHENHRKNNENRENYFFRFDSSLNNHAYEPETKRKIIRFCGSLPLSNLRLAQLIFGGQYWGHFLGGNQ